MMGLEEPMPAEIFEPEDGAPFSDEELDAYLAFVNLEPAEPGTVETYRAHGFVIDNDGLAAWAMAKYAEAEAELRAAKDRHHFMAERIASWLEANTKRPQRTAAFFGNALAAYALAERERDPKRKTLTLPSGKVSTRESKPGVEVRDEDELLVWAENAAPEVVKRSVSKSALADVVTVESYPVALGLTCGCIYEIPEPGVGNTHSYDVGSEWECQQCGKGALIGHWLGTISVAVDEDGDPVPGVMVTAPRLSVTVKAE